MPSSGGGAVDDNYDKLTKAFNDYSTEFEKDVQAELKRLGDLQVERSMAEAPVDTGYMRDHISITGSSTNSVTVTAEAEYSGYVDQGTWKMAARPFFSGNVEKIEQTEIPNIEKQLQIKIDAKFSVIR